MHFRDRIYFPLLITVLLGFVPLTYAQVADDVPVLRSKNLFVIKSNLSQPSDVVSANEGNIYVLDGVNNRVKVFSRKGAYMFAFGKAGTGDGEFSFPLGIGIDDESRIYIADSGNHRVQIFNHDGKYLSQFSTDSGKKGYKPSDPTDVVVSSKLKRCYVADNDNHCIVLYSLEEKKIINLCGTMGMEKREFRFPFQLDMDSDGKLYIVEVINTRVKVLDYDGSYISNIGGWGVEHGQFYRPKGAAVDSEGRLFVSDSYLGVVQVFNTNGEFLYVLGDEKGNILKFETPTGLFVDSRMNLYVVEMVSNSVRVLSLMDLQYKR